MALFEDPVCTML